MQAGVAGLLDILTTLTAQRSLLSLEKEFVWAWERLLPRHVVSLLNIEKDRNDRLGISIHQAVGVVEDLSSLFSVDHVSIIDQCMTLQECRSINLAEDAGSRMIVLPSSYRESQVLLLLGHALTPQEEQSARVLSQVYRNCMVLLNENLRDMLTGLLNRRSFEERVNEISAVLRRGNSGLQSANSGDFAAAVLDIDHFKRINDGYGHIVGDETLILFASIMRKTFRASDLLFRFGGEEFVILLTQTPFSQACTALERFRHNVEQNNFPQVGRVTVSIGYTRLTGNEFPSHLIDRADQALYYAKTHGRNQVKSFEALVDEGVVTANTSAGAVELF